MLIEEVAQEADMDQELSWDHNVVEIGKNSKVEVGLMLVTRKTLLTPKMEDDTEWFLTFSIQHAVSRTEFVTLSLMEVHVKM